MSALSGSETETDTEQWCRTKFARVHCVRRYSHSQSLDQPPREDAPRPYARVTRLVRRKQPSKPRVESGVQCDGEIAGEATKERFLHVFEFQPSTDAEPTGVDFFHGVLEDSDCEDGNNEDECCEAVAVQHKWWLKERVREKLLKAQRRVHRSLDKEGAPALGIC